MAQKSISASTHILDHDQVKEIRHALLIGLASYGEIERLQNAQYIQKACGSETPEDLRVIHPTGCADTASEFAAALRNLEYSEQKPESAQSQVTP